MGQTVRRKRSIDYTALADFRYEIRRFLNFSETAARAAGIEPHQHQALLVIKGLPASKLQRSGCLAERLQIQHHSAVELTDRLESKGLIRRCARPSGPPRGLAGTYSARRETFAGAYARSSHRIAIGGTEARGRAGVSYCTPAPSDLGRPSRIATCCQRFRTEGTVRTSKGH